MLSATNNSNKVHVYGRVACGWESVRTVFEQNLIDELDIGASLCIYYRGECVVDLCGGWKDPQTKKVPYTPDTLQLVFSTAKGMMATAIALCVERGWIDYDAPVAKYWPEFASNGKQNITVGDLMAHRAGLSFVDAELTSEDAYNWSRMISLLAAQKPHWEPGTGHGYHAFTLGYAAGELVRRVDPHCRTYGQFIRDELDNEIYVGVPNNEVEERVSPLVRKIVDISDVRPISIETNKSLSCSGAFPLGRPQLVYNEAEFHRAEIPAVNGITNARSLARVYSLLIGDINENGKNQKRLISEKTLREAVKNVTPEGEPDKNWYDKPTNYAKGGFQINSEYFKILGEDVFGHTGFGGSCAFAFPPSQLAYAYICNQLDPATVAIDERTIRVIQISLSVPTQITQECAGIEDGLVDEGDTIRESNIWGRLISINKLFASINLLDNEYSLGRGKTCSIVLNSDELQTSKYFLAYSSTHFKIIRDEINKFVYIHDLSSNGTYVNGEKIGKNNKQVLENNAEIALASKTHRVYVYIDANAHEDTSVPAHIREKYIISKQIGRGAYGEVKLCFIRGTCARYAMKIVAKKHFTHIGPVADVFNKHIKTECSILQALDHPCIISVYDIYDTPDAIYIILELVEGGELFNRIVANGQFDEATTKFLFRQMAIGVKYLHDKSITHRDLKPENILLTSPDTNETLIKITDFGLSRFIHESSLMKTFCGTPNYLAPEILITRGEGAYTNKVDVWSLGVILYICLVGYPPFSESPDSPPLPEQILKGLYTFPDTFWSEVSEPAKDLIRQMMCVDPNKRLTMATVLEHPWLADDHDNTSRVDKMMHPILSLTKSFKRPAVDKDDEMDDDDDTTPVTENNSNGRSKRVKH